MPKSAPPKLKFDEVDRKKVIAEVEKHFEVTLTPVGSQRVYLADLEGKSYWVFGGYGDWHGVSSHMLAEEQLHSTDGVFVVAKRHHAAIDVFSGQLKTLIANSRALSHTKTGGCQFHSTIRGDRMFIKEIPSITLHRLGPPRATGSPKEKELGAIPEESAPQELLSIASDPVRSNRVLHVVSWVEVLIFSWALVASALAIRDLVSPSDPSPAHNEWASIGPLVLPIIAAAFLLPALAFFRRWPNPWRWQLLTALVLASACVFALSI